MARSKLERAVDLTKDEEYLSALTLFLDVFGSEDAPPIQAAKAVSALSYFGLCLALVSRKYKNAIDLCKRAIDLEFYHGEHYANLTRVYVAAGNRKKALETAEAGLKVAPEDDDLLRARKELGVRARPPVPFLDRSNPINVSLGQARYAKKLADTTPKRKKS
jgi:tetratricopeptide (TPR) repeat protein